MSLWVIGEGKKVESKINNNGICFGKEVFPRCSQRNGIKLLKRRSLLISVSVGHHLKSRMRGARRFLGTITPFKMDWAAGHVSQGPNRHIWARKKIYLESHNKREPRHQNRASLLKPNILPLVLAFCTENHHPSERFWDFCNSDFC